jgi:tetratricopeptide (TPR) repeat protein
MKKYFLVFSMLLATAATFAQTGKKAPAKEKPPTQKEMADMMKEMQAAMDDISPEDKKMMDSLGFKMPDFNQSKKNVAGISDKRLAEAWEDENRVVPKLDAAKIASIPKKITSERLPAFLTALRKEITPLLDADAATAGDKLYSYLMEKSVKKEDMGNVATYLWSMGKAQLAIHLLSRVCIEDPTPNNLNNYASMLSMLGAGHLAIPVLENINKQIPKNAIILNNLGQAWFGLGEITKAEKYLDSAIAIFAFHPQANFTKAAICESKGNKIQAIEALKKSIKHTYSKEKEDKLRKLGYKLTKENVSIPFKPGADPLGLGRFRQPDYPKSVSELIILLPQWKDFDNDCDKKIAALQKELAEAGVKYEKNLKTTMAKSMQSINSGIIPASAQVPLYAKKASLMLEEVVSHNEVKMKKLGEKFMKLGTELDQLSKTRKRAAPEAPCEDHIKAENDFLNKCNELKQAYNNEFLRALKLYFNDMAYWSQYTSTDKDQYEIIKLGFMIGWLQKLKEYRPLLTARGYELGTDCVEKKDSKPFKLAEWDFSANCKYKAEINYLVVKQQINCATTTTTWDANSGIKYTTTDVGNEYLRSTLIISPKVGIDGNFGPIKAGASVKADITINMDKNGVTDWKTVIRAGTELGVGRSIGPIKAEATIGTGIEIEIDPTGVTDVNIVSTANAEIGIEAPKSAGNEAIDEQINQAVDYVNKGVGKLDTKVEIGMESRTSLISGHGLLSGTGILSGVKMSQW